MPVARVGAAVGIVARREGGASFGLAIAAAGAFVFEAAAGALVLDAVAAGTFVFEAVAGTFVLTAGVAADVLALVATGFTAERLFAESAFAATCAELGAA